MNETVEVSFARAEEFVAPSISASLLALREARIERDGLNLVQQVGAWKKLVEDGLLPVLNFVDRVAFVLGYEEGMSAEEEAAFVLALRECGLEIMASAFEKNPAEFAQGVRWASEFMDSVQHDVCCN